MNMYIICTNLKYLVLARRKPGGSNMTRPIIIDQFINEFSNTNTDRTVQAELKFWLNKILTADPQDNILLLHLCRQALLAKMTWPATIDHGVYIKDLTYLDIEEHLMVMYGWFLQDLGYDVADPNDHAKLHKYTQTVLSALN